MKAHISGRMASIGISDVVTASVKSEITRMKKCIMIMIITITVDPRLSERLGTKTLSDNRNLRIIEVH